MADLLPEFDNPPVIETVLSVEFAPLEKWSTPHFGLFWHEIRDRFVSFDVHPPIASRIEDPETIFSKREIGVVRIGGPPSVRCWFIDARDATLIQVQNDRFTFNWRKRDEPYPRYEKTIRPEFEREWSHFLDFVAANDLGEIEVLQCEVSYVNHFEIGKGWETVADFPDVFPAWNGGSSGTFLPKPENINFDISYRIPERKGRLRMDQKRAIRNGDGKEVIQFTVTARGRPESSDVRNVLAWLDCGREWVVRGFTDATSTKMHKIWGRTP